MPRNRMIKPEFFTSEKVVSVGFRARVLFVGLWCFSDDQGVHPFNLRRIKMEVFPGDEVGVNEIDRDLQDLVAAGLLQTFVEGGARYIHVVGWSKHQRIDRPTLRFPTPPDPGDNGSERPPDPQRPLFATQGEGVAGGTNGTRDPKTQGNGVGRGLDESSKRKKGKKGKEGPTQVGEASDPFDEFWTHYPRKSKKAYARTCYDNAVRRLVKNETVGAKEEAERLLLVRVQAYAASPLIASTKRDYRPHPSTWLNQSQFLNPEDWDERRDGGEKGGRYDDIT